MFCRLQIVYCMSFHKKYFRVIIIRTTNGSLRELKLIRQCQNCQDSKTSFKVVQQIILSHPICLKRPIDEILGYEIRHLMESVS